MKLRSSETVNFVLIRLNRAEYSIWDQERAVPQNFPVYLLENSKNQLIGMNIFVIWPLWEFPVPSSPPIYKLTDKREPNFTVRLVKFQILFDHSQIKNSRHLDDT